MDLNGIKSDWNPANRPPKGGHFMKSRLVPVLLIILVLSGCAATARLYPVQGPLSTQTPPPVYIAKLSGAFNSGSFSAVLNDGEVFKGRWEMVPLAKTSMGTTTASNPHFDNMSADRDAVYGTGFYVAHVLGQKFYGRAAVTGNRGTILNAEMYRLITENENARREIKGVAKDSKGNIYKLAF
jgi:hypothetical protein